MTLRQEREAARRHHERQQARRADRATRTRRRQQVAAVGGAFLLVVGGVGYAALAGGSDEQVQTSAEPSTGAEPSGGSNAKPSAGPVCPAPAQPQTKESGTYERPRLSIDPAVAYTAALRTNCGTIAIALDPAAPETVNSFRFLASKQFFDGTSCHRLTTEGLYVLQCGDPTGTGSGGPGYGFGIENAPADGVYPAGTVAMARTEDPNSNGSQFFLVYQDSRLPVEGGGYSVFGSITEGLDVVRKVAGAGTQPGSETPAQPITLETVVVAEQGE